MRDLAQRVPDDGVHHTVDVHALPDGRVRIGDHTFSPKELADMLRNDPNWNGQPIRLLSCDAGTSGLARDLANELGVPVTAPRGLAWTDTNGQVFSSSRAPDGGPTWPPDGGWDTHNPDGTSTPASNDAFHPSRDGEDIGDRPDDAEARGEETPEQLEKQLEKIEQQQEKLKEKIETKLAENALLNVKESYQNNSDASFPTDRDGTNQSDIDKATEKGQKYGCHICGPHKTNEEHYTPDHFPPVKLTGVTLDGKPLITPKDRTDQVEPWRLYPACREHNRKQGGTVRGLLLQLDKYERLGKEANELRDKIQQLRDRGDE
ncbi:hypothetical protein [Saccharopolyspora sp. 5N708]|uniref:hypothetical protein n=1 Tax=Saccharopolyspora sp. 5N708 TaxID=3457424 RepID=UPI003FD1F0C0